MNRLVSVIALLIHAREEAGITQRQLAARIGSSRSHLNAWEACRNSPSIPLLAAWTDALGYDVALVPREGDAAPVTGRRHVIRSRTGKRKEVS